MPTYIVLLRGINIGPHKRVKMDELVSSCAACGFREAKSYIQSGNVVFSAPKISPEKLAQKLEKQISDDFGFSADVISRTKDDFKQIIARNPLLKQRGIDPGKLHVVFLREQPSADAIRKLESLTLSPDLVRVAGKEIYFYFPNGVSSSSLWKHPLDKVLKVSSTMRNWNTINQLYEMAEEFE
jgi:uncharacterized protein (DUF1697 family)